MARMLQGLQWLLFALYAVAGAVALLIATPAGLKLLGQPDSLLTFLPAKILGLPWSLPLWFIPPLVLILPPLIWGWLTYKVMSFEVLAEHASSAERRQIMSEQHWPLLAIGVITGHLGAAHEGGAARVGRGVDRHSNG